jgi:DNA polymerase-4
LGRRACGFGGTEVAVERERKSESRERTFANDQSDPTMMRQEVAKMARTVAEHLGRQGIRGRTVTLKIRLAPFRTFTRSRTLADATADPGEATVAALALFDAFERDAPVRLLGVGMSNLIRADVDEAGPAAAGSEAAETGPIQLALG